MRANLENPLVYNPRVSGIRLNNVATSLSTTFVIPDEGPTVWMFDGGASDRTVRLPSKTLDRQLVIGNAGTTNSLNITDSAGVAQITLPAQSLGVFFATATRYIWVLGSFGDNFDTVITRVLSGTDNILATDISVQVNSVGVAVLTLPNSLTWVNSAGTQGLPLSIFDISGNASTNNITINPVGGQTISGMASLTIEEDYGGHRLFAKSGGGWIRV